MRPLYVLVFLAPLFLVVAVLLAIFDPGPVFYGHTRIGLGRRRFKCLKFRTMVPDAARVLEDYLVAHPELRGEWERDHKLRDDPRITRFGAWLRRLFANATIDELRRLQAEGRPAAETSA